MSKMNSETPDVTGPIELGVALGQTQILGVIASRCAAEQAAGLVRLRDSRNYRASNLNWREFCGRHLKISQTQADHIIRLWEEFGAGYFEVAQLTRISPESYRAIKPALKDGALQFEGETIELKAENAGRVSTAITALRKTARRRPKPVENHLRVDQIEKRLAGLLAELEEVARRERRSENWIRFAGIVSRFRDQLERLGKDHGMW